MGSCRLRLDPIKASPKMEKCMLIDCILVIIKCIPKSSIESYDSKRSRLFAFRLLLCWPYNLSMTSSEQLDEELRRLREFLFALEPPNKNIISTLFLKILSVTYFHEAVHRQ